MSGEGADLVNSATALLSMRSSSFDELSAYGEVIDNSIQANASFVKMKFETGTKHIRKLIFSDDGDGMDAETLSKCLSLGYSSRYNDRVGIGRFGVGMKLGAIHQCKRIEVWSKERGGSWLFTYLDLDEVETGTMTKIPVPIGQEPPAEFNSLVNNAHGTIIIWSKYDNLRKRLMELQNELPIWAGRTFRYFMWNKGPDGEDIPNRTQPLTIYIDGEEIKALDPLYHNKERNRFPDDPAATLFDPMTISWPVDTYGLPAGAGAPEVSDIKIRFSLLPEEWRKRLGSGAANPTTIPRGITKDSEGISILRNYREVWWGSIPYWKNVEPKGWSRFEATDRWWGCEIHFDAWLDRAFAVKNIKDGAKPLPDLLQTIKAQIMPSRKTAEEDIKKLFAKTKNSERQERLRADAESEVRRLHAEAERIASITPSAEHQLGKDIDPEEAIDEFIKDREQFQGEEERARITNLFESQPFTIEETNWRGSKFFEASHAGGRAILEYNMEHVFFEKIYDLLEMLDNQADDETLEPSEIAHELKVLIDLMIVSYARSEATFGQDTMMKAETFIDDMRRSWGQFLLNYINQRDSEL